MSPSPRPDVVGLARDIKTLGEELTRSVALSQLPPQAAEGLRSLIDKSGQVAALTVEMEARNRAQEEKIAAMAATIDTLSAQIARLERSLHGPRSERKRSKEGTDETDGGTATGMRRGGGKPGRRKDRGDAVTDTGLRYTDQAPVVDITVMPPQVEGLSKDDYDIVSERVHSRIATVDYRHIVIRYHHVTVKIRETGALAGAPARESVFKNSCADVSFIAAMLIDKFLWHLPIYRQHRMLALTGIIINRGTLTLWVNRAIALLKPIHDAQWRSVLESAIIQMDETPIRAGRRPGNPGSMKKGFLWPVLGDRGEVVFPFSPSRAHANVPAFLGEYSGTLVSDGYGAYDAYVKARNGAVRQQNCMTHMRRNFWEQKDAHPDMAGAMLEMIGELYAIEKEIKTRPASERLEARQARSRPVVDRIWAWCDRMLKDPALTPKHPIRKAIRYAVERRTTLELFLADPDVPLDTNLVENKIRQPKLGQRNWLFAFTELGAENLGIIIGLLATCQMQGVDPRIWLIDVLLRIDTHPADRVEELTPRVWKTLFADTPMTSDITSAVRLQAATAGPP